MEEQEDGSIRPSCHRKKGQRRENTSRPIIEGMFAGEWYARTWRRVFESGLACVDVTIRSLASNVGEHGISTLI